jgi:transcriptional regulator with XRE-family HTH domain
MASKSKKDDQNTDLIVFKKRLKVLKGELSLNAFATKCDIPYSTMRGYLEESASPSLDNLFKISTANNTHVAWLIGEDNTQESEKRYRGLTVDRHIEIGDWFKKTSMEIDALCAEIGHAFPEDGKLARPYQHLYKAYKELNSARSYAEENMFIEHGKQSFDIYYGKISINDDEKKQHGEIDQDRLPEKLSVNDNK